MPQAPPFTQRVQICWFSQKYLSLVFRCGFACRGCRLRCLHPCRIWWFWGWLSGFCSPAKCSCGWRFWLGVHWGSYLLLGWLWSSRCFPSSQWRGPIWAWSLSSIAIWEQKYQPVSHRLQSISAPPIESRHASASSAAWYWHLRSSPSGPGFWKRGHTKGRSAASSTSRHIQHSRPSSLNLLPSTVCM